MKGTSAANEPYCHACRDGSKRGVSTRKIEKITRELCGVGISKSTVSAMVKTLDPVVREWRERPLDKGPYPFLMVDAIVIKIRKGGRVGITAR